MLPQVLKLCRGLSESEFQNLYLPKLLTLFYNWYVSNSGIRGLFAEIITERVVRTKEVAGLGDPVFLASVYF